MKKQILILSTVILPVVFCACSKKSNLENMQIEQASSEETSMSTASRSADPLTVKLEGWYSFDGNLKDKSGKLADAVPTTRVVTYVTDRKGNTKSAIYLDSTYTLKIKSVLQQTKTSLSVWFKPYHYS